MPRFNMPSHLAEEIGKKNWTKAELEEKRRTEVVMIGDNIQPSGFLPEHLHKQFKWFVDEFEEYGILANVDSDALSRYVMADYQYWETTEILNEMKPDEEGYSRISNVQNRYFNQTQALAKELGLTMVSRGKLKRDTDEDDERELTKEEKLFSGLL